MRPLLPVALLLTALLFPLAGAEDGMRFEVEPLADLVKPLQGNGAAAFLTHVPCAWVDGHDQGAVLRLWSGETPPWMRLTLSPVQAIVHEDACVDGVVSVEGMVIVSADAQAPAFEPTPVWLHASFLIDGGNVTMEASLDVEADFFSILDVQVQEPIQVVKPGETANYRLVLINHGNSDVRILFEVTDASAGMVGEHPSDLVLQRGGEEEVILRLTGAGGSGYVNHAGSVTYTIVAEHPERGLRGDASTTVLLLTEKGWSAQGGFATPLSPLSALAGVLLVAFAKRRG